MYQREDVLDKARVEHHVKANPGSGEGGQDDDERRGDGCATHVRSYRAP